MAEDNTPNGEAEHRSLTPCSACLGEGVVGADGSCRQEGEERIKEE